MTRTKPLIIAVDGPAAAGKGTLARRLAAEFGLPHLDTGLLYRAVARLVLDALGDPADPAVAEAAAARLQPTDLARPGLRDPATASASSLVAAIPAVRARLLDFQRRFPGPTGAVLDGRDIGTVVFPDATAKLFVTADVAVRARRRWHELGGTVPLAQVETDLRTRDALDSTRVSAPLQRAPDAILLDTTTLDADAAFAEARDAVRATLQEPPAPALP